MWYYYTTHFYQCCLSTTDIQKREGSTDSSQKSSKCYIKNTDLHTVVFNKKQHEFIDHFLKHQIYS